MNRWRLAVAAATVLVLAVAATVAVTTLQDVSVDEEPGATDTDTVTQVVTAEGGTSSNDFGLLDLFEDSYSGDSSSAYDLNGSKPKYTTITEECGNCHMYGFSDETSVEKHKPPIHPTHLLDNDSGTWFVDEGRHRGPNTRLATQVAGIQPKGETLQCGNCHAVTEPRKVSEPDAPSSRDPHAVHRDVSNREGCLRCHAGENLSFESNYVAFTQGNASNATYGVSRPINMTRVWDGQFLSTDAEAEYSHDGSTNGSGWTVYGESSSINSTDYSCGDCHGQIHLRYSFTFKDSGDNRKGPFTPVKSKNSWGVNASGNYKVCRDCHVRDTHATHTNGLVQDVANLAEVYNNTDQSIINDGVRGAELCDTCHSQNQIYGNPTGLKASHKDSKVQKALGFANGTETSHNRPPDLESGYAQSVGDKENNGGPGGNFFDPSHKEDCGFCHQ